MGDLDRNRANAVAFYELAFNECRPREAIERFVGDHDIQRNPDVAAGKDGFVTYSQRMALATPAPGEAQSEFAAMNPSIRSSSSPKRGL